MVAVVRRSPWPVAAAAAAAVVLAVTSVACDAPDAVPDVAPGPGAATSGTTGVAGRTGPAAAPYDAAVAGTATDPTPLPRPVDPSEAPALLTAAVPDGFALERVGHDLPPSVSALAVGRSMPVTATVGLYRSVAPPPRTITATLAYFDSAVGPAALYNNWFAENAFMASAERNSYDVGDQAECFDVEWPPFHAVLARRAGLFVLVQSDASVPLAVCRQMTRTLVEGVGP